MTFGLDFFTTVSARRLATLGVQLGFCGLLVAGTYAFSQHAGASKDIARLVEPPAEDDYADAARGDRMPIVLRTADDAAPAPVEAVKPATPIPAEVPKPPRRGTVATAAEKAAAERSATARPVVVMPAGVERFDDCRTICDTRDPMVVASQPAPRGAPVLMPAQPAAQAESETLFGLPPLPSAEQLLNGAVDGTGAAIDRMKQAVEGAMDLVR